MVKKILSVALPVIAATLTLFSAVWILYQNRLIYLPDYIVNLISLTQPVSEIYPVDGERIFDDLNSKSDEIPEGISIENNVTNESALKIIEAIKPVLPYTYQNKVTITGTSGSIVTYNAVTLNDKESTVVSSRDDAVYRTVIQAGNYVTVKETVKNRSTRLKKSETQNLYTLSGIPDLNIITTHLGIHPSDTQIARSETDNIMFLEFRFDDINQRDCYYLSLDNGIILRAESYVNDIIVYLLETVS